MGQKNRTGRRVLSLLVAFALFCGCLGGLPFRAAAADGGQTYSVKLRSTYAKVVVLTGEDGTTQEIQNKSPAGTTVSLAPGVYQYTGYTANKAEKLGGGSFEVTEDNQIISFQRITIYVNLPSTIIEEGLDNMDGRLEVICTNRDVQFESTNDSPDVVESDGTKKRTYDLLVANGGSSDPTSLTFQYIPDDERLDCEKKAATVTGFTRNTSTLNLLKKVKKTVRVPSEYADLFQLYKKLGNHYTPFTKIEPSSKTEREDGYTDFEYYFPVQDSAHYTIRHSDEKGNIKLSRGLNWQTGSSDVFVVRGYSKVKEDYRHGTVGWKTENWTNFDLDNSFRMNLSTTEEANLYLNVDDSNYIEMKEGETQKLEAFRTWQAVDDVMGNYFIEPDFHYEVIGDSVKVEQGGEEGRRYATVTAEDEGVSVIKVTYDAMFWSASGSTLPDGSPIEGQNTLYYDAIAPVNTRVVVVNVGGKNTANIQPNMKDPGHAGTEYDTIYFDKNKADHAEYTFTPTADEGNTLKVRVHDPLHNTAWNTRWTDYEPDADGAYTVNLKDGRNIVEISADDGSVQYYVINCRALDVQIENLTREDATDYQVGDTIEVSFDGLTLPVQKMSGIYNPNFPDQGWVEYRTDTGRTLRSTGTQYNAVTKSASKIKVTLTEPGEFKMVGGQIHNTHLGSALNTHRSIPEKGMGVNMNASGGENSPYFSTLPDVTLTVKANEEEAYNAFSYAQLQGWAANDQYSTLTASNWADLDAVRNVTLVNALYMGDQDQQSTVDLKLDAQPIRDDVTLTARFREEGTEIWTDLGEVTPNELVTLKDGLSTKGVYYFEVTVTPDNPENGYTHTYTLRMTSAQTDNASTLAAMPMLTNLQIAAAEGSMEPLDGVLKATGEGTDDLGYGFLAGRHEFTVSVPEAVQSLIVTPAAAGEQMTGTADSGNYLEDAVYPTIQVNGAEVANEAASEAIDVVDGTTIEVKLAATQNRETTYTIHVQVVKDIHAVFENLEDGATLTVRDAHGQRIPADGDGAYTLRSGDRYSYIYSKPGYLTVLNTFTVSEENRTVTLPALKQIDQQDGSVSVRIAGPDSMPKQTTTISYTAADAADLAQQEYVEYNHGGYTVLHALIDACGAGSNRISFTCKKGQFAPEINLSDVDAADGAGWVCEVNGKAVTDPANTLAADGDKIEYYYNRGYTGMTHAWFEKDTLSITQGNSATVKLLGTAVKNDGTEAQPVANARIYVGKEPVGQTDENGELRIDASYLTTPGAYRITAQKDGSDGKNILTYALSTVSVKKSSGSTEDTGKTKVTFRLIGDSKHNDGMEGHNKYVTWIATENITINKSSATVGEVFEKALDNAGLDYVGFEKNYISSITAPEACGGYELAEFTNGPRSGWMYTVNGSHPDKGLNDWEVTTGDVIVWHYVDDYLYEVEDWFGGSKGDDSTWNHWLDAEDVNPKSDSSNTGGSTGTATETEDQKKANAVFDLIAAIGEVTKESGGKITAAREAYNKLTDTQKNLVNNYSKLTAAERAYAKLTGALPFTDVSGHWAANAIQYAYENGLFSGTSDTTFGPDVSMNRAMLVTVLYRMEEEPQTAGANSFTDVPANQWYTDAVTWACANNIVSGYSADKFGPTDTVTREQIASILNRYAKFKGYDVTATNELTAFTDASSVSGWALDSVKWANAAKLIQGRTSTTLVPKGAATRAEVAQILMAFRQSGAQ